MRVKYPPPDKLLLRDFIIESNHIANCDLTMKELDDTFRRKTLHPFAVGHFAAMDYAFKFINNPDWPARTIFQFDTEAKSHANTGWLRELNRLIMKPIALHNQGIGVTQILPVHDCGTYRLRPALIGLDRVMPKPTSIKKLIHHWYKNLGAFHIQIAPKLMRPSTDVVRQCVEKAEEIHHELCCIHPFEDGNGRCARLIENMLRLRWGLPWKHIHSKDSMKYAINIMKYEDDPNWHKILHTNGAI